MILLAVLLLAPLTLLRADEIVSLAKIRHEVLACTDALRVPGKPLGWYFDRPGKTNAPSLYASCDVAHMRTVMGEDLRKTLTTEQREAWIAHINSFAQPDGTYGPARMNHSPQHANGMVIGALGVLGGKQKSPVRLYDAFNTPQKASPWLETVDWRKQWSGSHLFWGGMHCFSMSRRCTDAWRKAVFDWLDANLDPQTGWWRKGVAHAGPYEPLGGGAHIWPIYQHHGRRFPLPERVIDSILALQKPDGAWLNYGNYMELDALYGLAYMSSLAPQHRRADILEAARCHGRGLVAQWPAFLAKKPDLHVLLGAVGAFGLLQQLLPETFVDNARWTDIFSDARLYQTRQVEAATAANKPARADKPNIVLILADDLGYGDAGCYGATKVKTPHVDRLAREGRRFTDAHSASAVCTPSRYALLTGQYPFRRNLWGPIMNQSPLVIETSRTTIASLLRRQGYATACFGKWHLGFGSAPKPDWNADLKPGPLEVGFDHFFGIPVVSSHPPFVWVENHRVVGLDSADPLVYGGTPPTQAFPEKMTGPAISGGKAAHALYRDEQLGTVLTEKATAWLRARRGGPFFLYLATPHIHHPFTPGPKFKGTSQCGLYGDFIREFDWMVGEVLRTLDELKLADNTLVILTSDNGGMLNQGGQDAWKAGHRLNGPLLGFKFDAWEGGHRVPFIARWPGKIEAGSVSDQLICHVDMLATFATLAGGKLADNDGPDSMNILPALVGRPDRPVRDHVVLAPQRPQNLAIRQGRWIYIGAQGGGGFQGTKPGEHALGGPAALKFTGEVNSDIEDGRIKPDAPAAQLYDLASDPSQTRNVIREHPDIVGQLRQRLDACGVKTASPEPQERAKKGRR